MEAGRGEGGDLALAVTLAVAIASALCPPYPKSDPNHR